MPIAPTIASRGLMKSLRTRLNRAGFDITREPFHFRFVHMIERLGINTVIDIGANTGQFAEELRAARFAGTVLSVEPLGSAYALLQAAAAADEKWIPLRAAVAKERGTLTINVSGNSVSSSVLEMLPLHSDAVPSSSYVSTEEVQATTVDRLVTDYSLEPSTSLLKIDVQGFEQSVLDGATATLGRFAAVQMELSLAPLYAEAALMPEMVARMDGEGFDLWLTEPAFIDPETGRMYQCDGVFVNRSPGQR